MSKTTPVTDIKVGAVLYTDGSAMPNPGYGGYGIHGYTYDIDVDYTVPKSQKTNIPTTLGYQPLNQLNTVTPTGLSITPIKKIDTVTAYGTPDKLGITHNGLMELYAMKKAMELAIDQQYKAVTIISDSQPTINALTVGYDTWKKNNWCKSDGSEIKMKEELITVANLKQKLESGSTLQFHWVKGHSKEHGNEIVDKLAKKGAALHQAGKLHDSLQIGKPLEKQPAVFHDLFVKNRWYFMGGKVHLDKQLKIGNHHIYFTGSLGDKKKDADFGMHMADGFSSIICLTEPEPILQRIQSLYREQCSHDYDFVVCGNLDTALSPANYHDIMGEEGSQLIIPDPAGKVLSLPNGKVVCMEYNPVHLSYQQMTRYDRLIDFTTAHLLGVNKDQYIYTDITSLLVKEDWSKDKKPKVKYVLDPTVVSRHCLQTDVQYGRAGQVLGSKNIKLTLKVEMPDKTHLAKLIKLYGDQIKISIMSKMVSDSAFYYCTVVEVDGQFGFWMNFDSSLAVI